MWQTAALIAAASVVFIGVVYLGYRMTTKTAAKGGADNRELDIFRDSAERQAEGDRIFSEPVADEVGWFARQRARFERLRGKS